MKTWVKGVYIVQEFAVINIMRFYGSESRFAIHDDRGAGNKKLPAVKVQFEELV